jgi:flavin-dependent dehydrogenase
VRVRDVVVVGGGPAGLAVAAGAARRGLDVLVLERRPLPADKACGEGLLPRAVVAIDALGVRPHLDPGGFAPFRSLRWIQEDGSSVEASLPEPGGLGVRRVALSAALAARARALGAEVRDRTGLQAHRREPDRVTCTIDAGEPVEARLLVAADGLASPVRGREGLSRAGPEGRRFGLRRHYLVRPWADAVEVHFAAGAEAYVTPAGPDRVGIAFLFEEGNAPDFDALLARFPRLGERVAGSGHDSTLAGSGPLARRASSRVLDRLVLVGDAGGYVDAITGEGLSLAFEEARLLAKVLPDALARGARREDFHAWDRAVAARFRRYATVARLVLAVARRPRLRRAALRRLEEHPGVFQALVARAVG